MPAASITSSTPCAISTRRELIAASASPSARATASVGHAQHIVQLPALHRAADVAEPDKLGATAFPFGAFNRDFSRAKAVAAHSESATARRCRVPRSGIAALRGDALRARGQAAGRRGGEGRLLARLRRGQARARHSFRHLSAALSGEFLESGVSEARQRRRGVAGVVDGGRRAGAPSRFSAEPLPARERARDDGDGFAIDLPRGAIRR